MQPATLDPSKTRNLVVSLDFGTSHSGYAFGKVGLFDALGNPAMALQLGSLIYVRDNWPGSRSRYPKTLSATLYDYDSQPIAFGDTALVKYLELRGSDIKNHALIRRVKLLLANDINYSDPELLERQLEPSQIIGDFLGFLKRDVDKHLASAGFKHINECRITWVMTIPATWNSNARQSMRAAAKTAGLDAHGSKVVFCQEPEAAILSVAITTNHIQHDDCVLVLDMGGGTVDWIAFQVGQAALGSSWHGLDFKLIVPSEGRTCGATIFDDAFFAFLRELIGVEALDSKGATESNVPSRLFTQWEDIKRTFGGMSDSPRWIQLGTQLQKRIPQGKITEMVSQNRYDEDSGEVCIHPRDVIHCFDQVFHTIVDVTNNMLSEASTTGKSINKLLCVGGFSDMPYMQRRIHETFGMRNMDIVFPLNAGGCVVQGALLYGIAPESVPKEQQPAIARGASATQYDDKTERRDHRLIAVDSIELEPTAPSHLTSPVAVRAPSPAAPAGAQMLPDPKDPYSYRQVSPTSPPLSKKDQRILAFNTCCGFIQIRGGTMFLLTLNLLFGVSMLAPVILVIGPLNAATTLAAFVTITLHFVVSLVLLWTANFRRVAIYRAASMLNAALMAINMALVAMLLAIDGASLDPLFWLAVVFTVFLVGYWTFVIFQYGNIMAVKQRIKGQHSQPASA